MNRRSKYNNRRVMFDGVTFDSVREANRYLVLRGKQEQGQIKRLVVHPRFTLEVHGIKICDYVADFQYELPTGERAIEDVKGVKTDVYRLKAKLMRACLGIAIREL